MLALRDDEFDYYVKAFDSLPSITEYREWTKVSKILAYGLVGVMIRKEKRNER